MAKDLYIISKRTNGPHAAATNPFRTLSKLSDIVPSMFNIAPAGTGVKCVAKGVYDFAVQGGAISTINLLPADELIPANALITSAYIDVVTAGASLGSATMSFGVNSTTDIKTATAVASLTATQLVGVPVPQTANTWIKTTAATQITASIATAAFTAGKINVYCEYVLSE